MGASTAVKVTGHTPLLLRRIRQRPRLVHTTASGHMTVVTTGGGRPEMHDQEEDATRYDKVY